jgi:hypothetical protein
VVCKERGLEEILGEFLGGERLLVIGKKGWKTHEKICE